MLRATNLFLPRMLSLIADATGSNFSHTRLWFDRLRAVVRGRIVWWGHRWSASLVCGRRVRVVCHDLMFCACAAIGRMLGAGAVWVVRVGGGICLKVSEFLAIEVELLEVGLAALVLTRRAVIHVLDSPAS